MLCGIGTFKLGAAGTVDGLGAGQGGGRGEQPGCSFGGCECLFILLFASSALRYVVYNHQVSKRYVTHPHPLSLRNKETKMSRYIFTALINFNTEIYNIVRLESTLPCLPSGSL